MAMRPLPRTVRKDFSCSKLGGVASIELEYLAPVKGAAETLTRFHCHQALDCGVATQSGLSTDYTWVKCVHPDSLSG